MKKKLGIYIHIPFCIQKCLYCDFLSMPAPRSQQAAYVRALVREMESQAPYYKGYRAETVFLGGGTPSLLSVEEIGAVFACLRDCYQVVRDAEITMEMNPGTVTEEKLAACQKAGVNRISLGLQSADNVQLRRLGRIHTWEMFLQSYRLCRGYGFDNINIDLMSGLPGQSPASWKDTLEKTIALSPEHISAYSLIIEEGTPFYEKYGGMGGADAQRGAWSREEALPDEDTEREMYEFTGRFLAKQGYARYEISNYARPGKACRHNCTYWTRGEYAGFGLGAASMVADRRWSNVRGMQEYLDMWLNPNPDAGAVRVMDAHDLSGQERMEETMYLGLRMTQGVSLTEFRRTFGCEMEEIYGEVLGRYLAMGLLRRTGDRVSLTDRGIDVSNYVLADFLL